MATNEKSSFGLLRTKEIIAILDGDTRFGEMAFDDEHSVCIAMPYLSGPDLCGLSTIFGLPATYSWGGTNLSRWQYLDNLIDHCIKNNKCSDLLSYLFGKAQFSNVLSGLPAATIDSAYLQIISEVMQRINGLLYFGGHELVILNSEFYIKKIGAKVEVQAPKIKTIDREYIKSISSRAMQDVDQSNYDSAITKARTLLEETFCYVVEKKGDTPSSSGNMSDLYKQVKGHYNMHADSNTDRRINTLLSGLEKIVSAISEMRNKDSDAHGVGASRISIDEHHARLFVNAAVSMADFILSVEKKANQK